jgi:hypothetical protein
MVSSLRAAQRRSNPAAQLDPGVSLDCFVAFGSSQ